MAESWVALARACEETGDTKAACIAHEHVLSLRVDDVAAHLAAGLAFGANREHEKAVSALQRAALLSPENVEVYGALGLNLLALERFDPASRALTRATSLAPDQPAYHIALARAELGLAENQNAADSLEQAPLAAMRKAPKRLFSLQARTTGWNARPTPLRP